RGVFAAELLLNQRVDCTRRWVLLGVVGCFWTATGTKTGTVVRAHGVEGGEVGLPKIRLLHFVSESGSATSQDVAAALGYTLPGAASMLLRLHKHGHLRRQRDGHGFVYMLSEKGEGYLNFVGAN